MNGMNSCLSKGRRNITTAYYEQPSEAMSPVNSLCHKFLIKTQKILGFFTPKNPLGIFILFFSQSCETTGVSSIFILKLINKEKHHFFSSDLLVGNQGCEGLNNQLLLSAWSATVRSKKTLHCFCHWQLWRPLSILCKSLTTESLTSRSHLRDRLISYAWLVILTLC